MADEPQLVVAITARLDQFEKKLKDAGLIAEEAMRSIQTRMGTIAGGTALGNIIADAIKAAMSEVKNFIQETQALMLQLDDTARRTGVSFEDLQRIGGVAMATSGMSQKQMLADLQKMAAVMDDMNRSQTTLAKYLAMNNAQFRDASGHVVKVDQGLEIAATLMQRAASESEKIKIAQLFGLSEQWVKSLGQGVDHLRAMQASMPTEDLKESVRWARAMQAAINRISVEFTIWGNNLNKIALPALQTALGWLEAIATTMADITAGQGGGAMTDFFVNLEKRLKGVNKAVEDIVGELAQPTRITVFGPGTLFPDRNALIAAENSLKKRTELLQEQTRTVAESTREQEGARAVTELVTAAEREQIPVTDELMKKFATLGAAYGQAAQDAKVAQAQFELMNENSREFGQALSEAFKSAVIEGKKLNDVLKSLVNRLASRSIDKLFDLFFAPTPGAGGTSLFTQLLKGLTGKQAGGPVSGGQPYMVGERGPEVFVPNKSGMIIPNSAATTRGGAGPNMNFNTMVDARGSTMTENQFRTIIAENNRLLLREVDRSAPRRQQRLQLLGT